MRTWLGLRLVVLCGIFAIPANASLSRAMQFKCTLVSEYKKGDLNKDDALIQGKLKAFLPEPGGAPSLRLLSLTDEAPQVALAMQGIRSTCHDYQTGKMPEYEADQQLSSFENTIQDFEESLGKEALIQASSGNVSSIANLRPILTTIAAAGRQDELLGEDLLADAAMHLMVQIVETFDEAFSTECYNQSFDRDIALALERQRGLLGLPTDVSPCANRPIEAKWHSGIDTIIWKHCGLGFGVLHVQMTGTFAGLGQGNLDSDGKGEYSMHYIRMSRYTASLNETGDLNLHCVRGPCECLKHPEKEECKGVDTSKVEFLLSVKGNPATGLVYFPAPLGPRHPEDVNGPLTQDYPVKFNKVDKPCKVDED